MQQLLLNRQTANIVRVLGVPTVCQCAVLSKFCGVLLRPSSGLNLVVSDKA